MVTTVSLLNSHVFAFIATFIIALIVISIYMMITPEKSTPYNFDPFPTETPSAMPDPSGGTDGCWDKLTACDSNGQCNACDVSQYECKKVDKDNIYHFNGINVPKGNWCLKKDNNPNPQCNPLTGRWIWTYDPEYCSSHGGGSQCWKCHCLYPSMFAGQDTGCEVPIACQNDSVRTQSIGQLQTGNILQPTGCAPESIKGCTWGPNGDVNAGCESISQLGPYDTDMDGNPLFSCACGDRKSSQYFAKLPNDPYTCHLEPCFSYMNSTSKGLQCDTDSCGNETNCHCECPVNFAKSPSGEYEGTCVLVSSACGAFGYSEDLKQCTCGEGPYWQRQCKSALTGVNMDTDYPDCTLPQNALGSECYNPCAASEIICQNSAPCLSCGPSSYLTTPECNMAQDGTLLNKQDVVKPHAACQCASGKKPLGPNDGDMGGYFGPTCSKKCLADGVELSTSWFGTHRGGDTCGCNCCCSLRSKTRDTSFWDISEVEQCDGSWPTVDSPADSSCLPAADNCSDSCHAYG
jgi:hypothetical protein